jgi:hypothetical protein
MVTRRFAITWDYRCPYARIAHDHAVTALRAGAGWDVAFMPFSLGQAHVEPGEPDIWDDPSRDTGILALQVGVAVRDRWPAAFLEVHHGLFELRHRHGGSLLDPTQLAKVLHDHGLDADEVMAEVATGRPLATIRDEHTTSVRTHHVWGVPTFLVGDRAVFVRLLEPPGGDATLAVATIERVLDQIDWPMLNELKHTTVPR